MVLRLINWQGIIIIVIIIIINIIVVIIVIIMTLEPFVGNWPLSQFHNPIHSR
jgi:hypothetical protein